MRIGIDARMIDNSGIGTYLRNILRLLPKTVANEYVLFGGKNKLEKYGLKIVESDYSVYGIKEQVFYPGVIRKSEVDLFHFTHYNVPALYSGKFIVTIYDLIHVLFPEYLPSKLGYFYARYMIKNACEKAAGIITISEHTKNDLVRYFKVAPERIRVVAPGVEAAFSQSRDTSIKERHGEYILYVGNLRPHKNIHGLIEGYCKLRKIHKRREKLILIGKGKAEYRNVISEIIESNDLKSDVIILENMPGETLKEYYAQAKLFVFPSFYEGFGLPPLEAMASGCPVVASKTSSLPEVVGDAGILIEPRNTDEMAVAMNDVISNDSMRSSMIRKGIERAKIFSWEKSAGLMSKIYGEIAGN